METDAAAGGSGKYDEFLYAGLRGSYQEVQITGKIKEWSKGINAFFQDHTTPGAPDVSITLTADQFIGLPDAAQELIHDLRLTPESHPTIRITRPNEDKGFSIAIDPQDYIQDGNAGITLVAGSAGVGSEVRFKNHTGNVVQISAVGFGRSFGSDIAEKYFSSLPPGKQGDYALATSNAVFFNNKKVAFLDEMIPWVKEQYLRRHDIERDPDALSKGSTKLNQTEAIREAQQTINPPTFPRGEERKALDRAEELLRETHRKIPGVLQEASAIVNALPDLPEPPATHPEPKPPR